MIALWIYLALGVVFGTWHTVGRLWATGRPINWPDAVLIRFLLWPVSVAILAYFVWRSLREPTS